MAFYGTEVAKLYQKQKYLVVCRVSQKNTMANPDHLSILIKGPKFWNDWRTANPDIHPDLSKTKITGKPLRRINFENTNLQDADLRFSMLSKANLSNAQLQRADLRGVSLRRATLTGVDFTDAILRHVTLAECNIENAIFTGCQIYGISAWNLEGKPKDQSGLIIQAMDLDPILEVDDLEVAQFINLLLHNEKIRNVIDTVTSKTILILGRFTGKRKIILDTIKNSLTQKGFVPILFDFIPSQKRDLTETVQLLANMAKIVIADLSDAKSIPQELSVIIPNLHSVPIQPILSVSQEKYSMFEHWENYNWVMDAFYYSDKTHLMNNFDQKVLQPAEDWMLSKDRKKSLEEENELLKREIEKLKQLKS